MAEICLYFEGDDQPQLVESLFRHPEQTLEVIGRNLRWQKGTKALSLLLAEARLCAPIAREAGGGAWFEYRDPPAGTLYEAFRKNEKYRDRALVWPCKIFGERKDERPGFLDIIKVDKTLGKPKVEVDFERLPRSSISLVWNGTETGSDSGRLSELIGKLRAAWNDTLSSADRFAGFDSVPEERVEPEEETDVGTTDPWTGYRATSLEVKALFEKVLREAMESVQSSIQQAGWNDEYDEDRNMILQSEATARFGAYYRAGKHCADREQLSQLVEELDATEHVGPRSFLTGKQALEEGFEDAQEFIAHGAEAESLEELEQLVEEALASRTSAWREADWYYRRLMMGGYLGRRLSASDISPILRLMGLDMSPVAEW